VRFAPPKPISGAISVVIAAYMSIPASWPKKKKRQAREGEIRPTKKPDFDNLAKFVGDSLNGIFWQDDKQIVSARVMKFYSDRPRWEIEVSGNVEREMWRRMDKEVYHDSMVVWFGDCVGHWHRHRYLHYRP